MGIKKKLNRKGKREIRENKNLLTIGIGALGLGLGIWSYLKSRRNKERIKENEVILKKNKKGIKITLYRKARGYLSDGTWSFGEDEYIDRPFKNWGDAINSHRWSLVIAKVYGDLNDVLTGNNPKELFETHSRGPYNLSGSVEMKPKNQGGMILSNKYKVNKYLNLESQSSKEEPTVSEIVISEEKNEYFNTPCQLYLKTSTSFSCYDGNHERFFESIDNKLVETQTFKFPNLELNDVNIEALEKYFPPASISEYNLYQ